MAEKTITQKNVVILFDVRKESEWQQANPVLEDRRIGFTRDGRFKIGDGSTAWNSLDWANPNASA